MVSLCEAISSAAACLGFASLNRRKQLVGDEMFSLVCLPYNFLLRPLLQNVSTTSQESYTSRRI